MKRLLKCVKGDVYLQIKYGFYFVYAVITLLYIVMLKQLPYEALVIIIPFFIFSDPGVLGFYFIGGLVLLERGEGVLEYLVATPLRIKEYLISKMISLTTISLLSSMIIEIFSYGLNINYPLLIIGVILTSFLFILIGFIAVAKFPTINQYLLSSILYVTILCLPLVDFFGIYKSWFFYIFPTQASLLLIKGAFTGLSTPNIIYGILYLSLLILVAFKWAHRSFVRFIIIKEGDK